MEIEKETYSWKGVCTTKWFHAARCTDYNFFAKRGKTRTSFFTSFTERSSEILATSPAPEYN
jgi:hypothetical protein